VGRGVIGWAGAGAVSPLDDGDDDDDNDDDDDYSIKQARSGNMA